MDYGPPASELTMVLRTLLFVMQWLQPVERGGAVLLLVHQQETRELRGCGGMSSDVFATYFTMCFMH